MSYKTVQLTREQMKEALLGEEFRRVGSSSGRRDSFSSGDQGRGLQSGALKALGSMLGEDKERRYAGNLREAMNPGSAKTWESGGFGGYGGGYGFKDLTPTQLDQRGFGVF